MIDEAGSIQVHVHWLMKALSWIAAAFFLFAAWASFDDPTGGPLIAAFFLMVAALSVYVIFLTTTTLTADSQCLTVKAPHGTYQINWSDVQLMETNGVSFVVRGNEKQLSFNLSMAGAGKQQFLKFLTAQVRERQIKVQPLSNAFAGQKNTRIH